MEPHNLQPCNWPTAPAVSCLLSPPRRLVFSSGLTQADRKVFFLDNNYKITDTKLELQIIREIHPIPDDFTSVMRPQGSQSFHIFLIEVKGGYLR